MHLFKQRIVTYTLADGSYRTPDGERVTAKTPGAVKRVSESEKWYASIGGKKVPLHESKTEAKKLYALKSGKQAVTDALPPEARKLLDVAPHLERKLTDALEDYRRYIESKDRKPDYVERTYARCKAIVKDCGFEHLQDVSADAVLHYLHTKRKADKREKRHGFGLSTSNHYITAIKGFCRWLVKDIHAKTRQTLADPLLTLDKLQADADIRVERRALSAAEFDKFIKATRKGEPIRGLTGEDRATLYTFAAYTGARASELASLVAASLDLDSKPATATVKAAHSKRGKKDVLPLKPAIAAMMREYIRGKPGNALIWPAGSAAPCEHWRYHAAVMVKADLEAAGIPYIDAQGRVFDAHALRHQFITNLARAGVGQTSAQKLARHSTPNLTAGFYTHLELADQAESLDKVPEPAI
jgi:integrase